MEDGKSLLCDGIVIITRLIGIVFLAHAVSYWSFAVEDFMRTNHFRNYINFVSSPFFYWSMFRCVIFLILGFSFLLKPKWIIDKISWGKKDVRP